MPARKNPKCQREFRFDLATGSPRRPREPAHPMFWFYDAVCHFNDDNRSTADIFREAGIELGHHNLVACCTSDQYRVEAQCQSTGEAKHRKKRRAATKAKREFVPAKEGSSYEPDGF